MRTRWMGLLGICLLAATGCTPEDKLKKVIEPHPQRQELRLLAAMINFPFGAMVFKVSGPADAVEKNSKAFDAAVEAYIGAKGEEPKVPTEWVKLPANEFREGGYFIPGTPDNLELIISVLQGPEAGDVDANLRRWRNKLGLPTRTIQELRAGVTEKKIKGREVVLVDMRGALGQYANPTRPDIVAPPVGHPPVGHPPIGQPKVAPKAAGELPFETTVPEGWKVPAMLPEFAARAFELEDGAVRISLSPFPGGVGGLVANVQRWRKQVGLAPEANDKIEKSAVPLDLGFAKGHLVDIDNPAGPQRIIGTLIPHEEVTWVARMIGPREAVGKHKADFEAYVRSFKLGKK